MCEVVDKGGVIDDAFSGIEGSLLQDGSVQGSPADVGTLSDYTILRSKHTAMSLTNRKRWSLPGKHHFTELAEAIAGWE